MSRKLMVGIIIIVIIIFLIPRLGQFRIYFEKRAIDNLVRDNLDFLNRAVEDENYDRIMELDKIKESYIWKEEDGDIAREYFCKGYGIASSGIYTGFYYSSGDRPIFYRGQEEELVKNKKGWEWKESKGDNFYYTEKIASSWYYYRFGF